MQARPLPKTNLLKRTKQKHKTIKTIGLLSDTHGYWDDRYPRFFEPCDEIWHAGDIGQTDLYLNLSYFRPVRAVYGNIDGYPLRQMLPKEQCFTIEQVNVLMTHIGGYPGKYAPGITTRLIETKPQLFISGHSHILKVKYDPDFKLLHINPGAAGREGFHKVRTLVRFCIDQKDIKNLEVMEIPLNESN